MSDITDLINGLRKEGELCRDTKRYGEPGLYEAAAEALEALARVNEPEPEWEYGTAIQEPDGTVWDHDWLITGKLPTAAQLAAWNKEHAIGNDTGSRVVIVRHRKATEWEVTEPLPMGGNDE